MDIAINGSGTLAKPSIAAATTHIVEAEQQGFSRYWLAQTGLVDALTLFTALAPATSTIRMGTAVVPTYPRHPSMMAGQALTAAAATGGRVDLGIGLSHKPAVEGRWGLKFEKPIRHMLDYLNILEPLMHEGKSDYSGEMFTTIAEAALITDTPPPLYIAALGSQMLRIAGQRSAGTLLWMVGPKTIAEHISPEIQAAAQEAGRPAPEVICSLPVCVTDNVDDMRKLAASAFTLYGELPSYRAMLDREGAAGPEDVAIIGSAGEVADRLRAIGDSGATEFSAVEFVTNPDDAAATRECLRSLLP
ncbi:MAG: 5,10-methylenetetrahydromethanopterin reductase [Candidatus Poriferisodalaceae bacterium]|jgi:5,10-methylenetetrahydromethanopterin reductase